MGMRLGVGWGGQSYPTELAIIHYRLSCIARPTTIHTWAT